MKTALTIGFFDGVHLGHRALLKKLREKPHATILTFSNHPRSVLRPPAPELLISYELRIERLKEFADQVIVVPFTAEFADIGYRELLDQFDLSHIVLGEGAVFGKRREGDEPRVREYGKEKGIIVEYVPKILLNGELVSSSRIRSAIASSEFDLAQKLLGTL
jgi:riboflavin kinase/FMN adenylyltransferase